MEFSYIAYIDSLDMYKADHPSSKLPDYFMNGKLYNPMREAVHRLIANNRQRFKEHHQDLQVRFQGPHKAILKHPDKRYLDMLATAAEKVRIKTTRLYDLCLILMQSDESLRKILKTTLKYIPPGRSENKSHFMIQPLDMQGRTRHTETGKPFPVDLEGKPKRKNDQQPVPTHLKITAPKPQRKRTDQAQQNTGGIPPRRICSFKPNTHLNRTNQRCKFCQLQNTNRPLKIPIICKKKQEKPRNTIKSTKETQTQTETNYSSMTSLPPLTEDECDSTLDLTILNTEIECIEIRYIDDIIFQEEKMTNPYHQAPTSETETFEIINHITRE